MTRFLVLLSAILPSLAEAQALRVGVAISLQNSMTEVAGAYEAQTGQKVEWVFGSSGQILAQITNGAPIDAFISAANAQVDELERTGLALPGTRRTVAGNTLVLVVPASAGSPITSFQSLTTAPPGRIAIGEPTTVPAGLYATQLLARLGLDSALKPRLVYGSNVRQVLSYVERGEVIAGIVYSTDARESGDRVRVVATAPADSHQPIVYPAVVVNASRNPDPARRFLDFLGTEPATKLLREKGFSTPPSTRPSE